MYSQRHVWIRKVFVAASYIPARESLRSHPHFRVEEGFWLCWCCSGRLLLVTFFNVGQLFDLRYRLIQRRTLVTKNTPTEKDSIIANASLLLFLFSLGFQFWNLLGYEGITSNEWLPLGSSTVNKFLFWSDGQTPDIPERFKRKNYIQQLSSELCASCFFYKLNSRTTVCTTSSKLSRVCESKRILSI